jgi:hypothetical protein
MGWTQGQQDALTLEYVRVGVKKGESWPYPSDPEPTPAEFLELLRSIPDGAGLDGYLMALRRRANSGVMADRWPRSGTGTA